MTKVDDSSEKRGTRAPYATPKMVVLGQVRDLTLSGGTSTGDGKGTRGKSM